MTAPTQALPPWLSPSIEVLPQTTLTTLVYLPLTYYGPSIPLDTDWTYGGLTSPASSTVTITSSSSSSSVPPSSSSSVPPSSTPSVPPSSTPSVPPSSTPSVTPSSSASTTSSTPPTSSPTSASTPISISASSSSAPPTPTSQATSFSSHALSRSQIIGTSIGAVLALLVLALLVLCLCGRRRSTSSSSRNPSSDPASTSATYTAVPTRNRRKPRFLLNPFRARTRARTRFTMVTPPVDTGSISDLDAAEYFVVPRSPDAVPARAGGEADPFLERLPNPHPVGVLAAGAVAATGSGNGNSASSRNTGSTSASSGTNTSGYGVLLAHPSLSLPPDPSSDEGHPFALPPGAGAPHGLGQRRILSPAQLAILTEEDVLPSDHGEPHSRKSSSSHSQGGGEDVQVLTATRVPASSALLAVPMAESSISKEKRRSWLPSFSWLLPSSSSSRPQSRDIEEEGGLLFDAAASPPLSPTKEEGADRPPRLVTPNPASPPPPSFPQSAFPAASTSGNREGTSMREFGARPLLAFLSSRPVSGVSSGAGSSGSSGGGTVFHDARETLSTQNSFARGPAQAGTLSTQGSFARSGGQDPLDAPTPAPLAAFSSASSSSSLHSVHSASGAPSLSHTTNTASNTLGGSSSGATLNVVGAPLAANAAQAVGKPQRAYGVPPGLGWDVQALELGFSRPVQSVDGSRSTAGSSPLVLPPGAASPFGGAAVPLAAPNPSFGGAGGGLLGGLPAPRIHSLVLDRTGLDLSLDDAPPGAGVGWARLGGSSSEHLSAGPSGIGGGSASMNEWGVGEGWDEGVAGRRGTFGGAGSAQYVHSTDHPSEHASLHSRLVSLAPSSLTGKSPASSHLQAPSTTSGSSYSNPGSARSVMLTHAGSVEGPMSPAVSAFGRHARRAGENSGSSGSGAGSRRQENSSGSGHNERALSPGRGGARSPGLRVPWAGGLGDDWRAT
ncbi:hypothetical protein B0H10DRAFT_2220052 [Mycena sp. CBHHK59/15]|nr:hypothetical protein B0H10DRAFT_2220052 [Mycena sp. CBHHK59/15]